MTIDPRWPREAHDIVLGVVATKIPHAIKRADTTLEILEALADAGLLVEPAAQKPEPMTAVMSVRFTEAEAAALQHYANQRTWSVSEAVRHIIRTRLLADTPKEQP